MTRAPHLSALLVLLTIVVASGVAHAHDTTPGVLALEELDDGRFAIAWTPPVDARTDATQEVLPRFGACTRDGAFVDCGARRLDEIVVDGLAGTRMRVIVHVERRGAAPHEAMATADAPRVALDAPNDGLSAWVSLGIEHVVFGLDHVAFLIGLLLVSTLDRRLLVTVTAFTLAHSVTLALAVLDVVRPSSRVVEALIASSVLLVAREALRGASSSVRRAPWAIASVFGLVHGLGLAGALREVGLPQGSLVSALFGFNVGVELGQLAIVGLAIVLVRASAERPTFAARARTGLAYAIGCAAAYWLVLRTLAMVA